jgi:hypothetical protein
VGGAAVADGQAGDEGVAAGWGDAPDGVVLVLLDLELGGVAVEFVVLGERGPGELFELGELRGVGKLGERQRGVPRGGAG